MKLDTVTGLIHEIASQNEAPFYLYDPEAIRDRCRELTAIPYVDKSIHFATMANTSPAFLDVVRQAGVNVFVNSVAHLSLAQGLGFSGEQVVFTASAMDEQAMRQVRAAGAVLNLDSTGQLETWWQLFPRAPVGIRCNIGDQVSPQLTRAGYALGKGSRLGLTMAEIDALAGDTRICGLHLYLGTDLTDLDYFRDCYRHLAALAPRFPALRYLDFGGGFGLPKGAGPFDMATYGRFVSGLMEEVSGGLGQRLRLILEPGRIIAAAAGSFVCRVNDVKQREERQLVGVNASSAQFPRPLFYPDEAHHALDLLPHDREDRGPDKPTAVYGCSTYSRDFLAHDARLPLARKGDLIVFHDAGAYCASAHTAFLGFPPAGEFFL